MCFYLFLCFIITIYMFFIFCYLFIFFHIFHIFLYFSYVLLFFPMLEPGVVSILLVRVLALTNEQYKEGVENGDTCNMPFK